MGKQNELEHRMLALEKRLREQNIVIVRGTLGEPENNRFHVVNLDSEPAEEACNEFVATAKALGAKFVVVQPIHLSREHLDDALAIVNDFEPAGPVGAERKRRLTEELQAVRKYIGETAAVYFEFFTTDPAVLFSLSYQADWHDAVYEVNQRLVVNEDEEDEIGMTEEEVEAYGKQLAADTRTARMLYLNRPRAIDWHGLAMTVLGKDVYTKLKSEAQIQVIAAAERMFEMEVRPELEAELGRKAQKMLDGGMKRMEVAARLKVTVPMLTKLLVMANE